MKRILLAAVTTFLLASAGTATANGPSSYGLGCGGACLNLFGKIHQHGPLYNYGPYYGYPPFEPYGPWNQYLQYGASSGYAAPSTGSYSAPAPASTCPTCNNGAPIIQPPVAQTANPYAPQYGYAGSYNPYYPVPYYQPYAPQYVPQTGAPVVPVQYRNPATNPTR